MGTQAAESFLFLTNQLQGGEVNTLGRFVRTDRLGVSGLVGFHYLNFTENLDIGFSALHQPGKVQDLCDQTHFWSLHTGGANFLFGDGHVRFLAYAVDSPNEPTSTFTALCTRNEGEMVSGDY